MLDDEVRLEIEAQRTNALFQRVDSPYFPLAVAAAIAFHEAHHSAAISVSQRINRPLTTPASSPHHMVTESHGTAAPAGADVCGGPPG